MNQRTRGLVDEAIAHMNDIGVTSALIVVEEERELLIVRDGQIMTFHQDDRLNLILSVHPESRWNMSQGDVVIHADPGHFIIAPDGEYTMITHDGIAVSVPFEI